MMISIDSVSVTVAIASGPSFDTQKMSATANTDSITISSTIGTASSRMARPSGRDVKSWRAPRSDSRTSDKNPSPPGATTSGDAAAVSGEVIEVASFTSTTNDRPPDRQRRAKKLAPEGQAALDRALFFRDLASRLAPLPRRIVVGVGRFLGRADALGHVAQVDADARPR